MSDIEVKRKELEIAKRIRDNGYSCHSGIPCISCYNAPCPSYGEEKGCLFRTPKDWDAFISSREAELSALEETPHDGLTHEERVKELTGSTNAYSKPRLYIGKDGKPEYIMPLGPTLDDFALALIQGGYFNMTMGEDAAISNLISRAEKIKEALDARREA